MLQIVKWVDDLSYHVNEKLWGNSRKTLQSLETFAEIVILDTGSTDSTLQIAQKFPSVIIHQTPFTGFGPLRNQAAKLASYDWILAIDSDESLSSELIREIHSLPLSPTCIYSLDRHNYYQGKHIKGCGGWSPDRVLRLYHRKTASYDNAFVHEKIIQGSLHIVHLQAPLLHVPYRKMSDFLAKMQTYSTLFAEQNKGKKKGSLLQALLHSWHAFFKSYIFKRGFLQGREGFIISLYNGHTAFYKYLKLSELNCTRNCNGVEW